MLWHQNPEPREAEYRTVEVRPFGASLVDNFNPPGFVGVSNVLGTEIFEQIMGDQARRMQGHLSGLASQTLGSIADRAFGATTRRELAKRAETVIEHLIRLSWLEVSRSGSAEGLRLTELGTALLRDHEFESVVQEDVSVVVLESQDPLAYPLLVSHLVDAGEGLLIDAYLKLDGLHMVVTTTRLTRLLVSANPRNESQLAAMQTYLDSDSLARRDIEMRASTEVHDRILLAEDGQVRTLGTSLNSVGTNTTVLTPMPAGVREFLRGNCERLWAEATLVGPQTVAEVESEDQTDDDETESDAEADTANDD